MKHTLVSVIRFLIILSLMIPGSAAFGRQLDASTMQESVQDSEASLFRTVIRVNDASRRDRLIELGVQVITETEGTAVVLVTAEQLESLARLGFEPSLTETLNNLVSIPLDNQVKQSHLSGLLDSVAAESASPEESITALVQNLGPQETAALAGAAGTDDDADGLTNTVETWWCTNPLDNDTDDDGKTDNSEINALKDWINNRRPNSPVDIPWATWPFNTSTCPDKDMDSIPNLAERWELGLNMDMESTDRDRFDDGQELFGVTYCPGSGNACGYGSLPSANHDGILLFPQMPSWVVFPGNHPLIAAFPKLAVDIVKGSNGATFNIQAATTITTDTRTEEGEIKSYSTTKTEGSSTSDAQTETWENWEEVSNTTETQSPDFTQSDLNLFTTTLALGEKSNQTNIKVTNSSSSIVQSTNVSSTSMFLSTVNNFSSAAKSVNPVGVYATEKLTKAADFVLDEACAELSCKKYAGAAVRGTVRTTVQSFDSAQKAWTSNQCGKDFFDKLTCSVKAFGTTFANNLTSNFNDRLQQATLEEQEVRGQVSGNELSYDGNGIGMRTVYPISYPVPSFIPTTTTSQGSSHGGAHTTTHTTYQEQSVTEGTSKQFGRSWGNATAQNSAHAADLWFAYEIKNIGTDYAREICNLAINIFIGNDSTPITTYYPGNDIGSTHCFSNFRPGESHKFAIPTSSRIQLTLSQLQAIDTGQPVYFVIEDYSLGQDDFYTDDAVKGGVALSIEDGNLDGNEDAEVFIVPTWGNEYLTDVISRVFPIELDDYENLVSIWTPEYQSTIPSWCIEPDQQSNRVWCKRSLLNSDWWSIYLNGIGDGSSPLSELIVQPDTQVLIRINRDDDQDGYGNLSEERLGTDPNDPGSIPHPELLGGLHSVTSGSNVVATLSLLNSGLYDAYGVEAVMIAPDDTITITNNTVGGSGRVKAGQSVIVGSRIMPAVLGTWTGTAKPASSGYYIGTTDRVYSFTVTCDNPGGCEVGTGSWTLAWTDGHGGTGSLPFGTGYASPTPLAVGAFGVKVGMLSGRVYNGNTFAVQANTPRDTFQYTINSEPHSQPVVLVSYNDPQGNHRFILPTSTMSLPSPTADLVPFAGQMRQDPGVELVTLASFLPGANTTQLVVNNPTGVTLTNSKLFLEFIDPEGTVVAEVSAEQDFAPGPSVVPVAWDSGIFAPAYNPEQDYIVLAFWTDLQGNILDTAGRPLSSFQQDPKPEFAMAGADATWDFGTAAQGTVMRREFTFANTGQLGLLTYVEAPAGLSVSQTGSQGVAPADITRYAIALSTEGLPLGTYDQTLTIHTSDPDQPTQTVRVLGTISAGTADTPVGQVERPLDYTVTVPGPKSQGEWYEFTHDLGPDPQSLHPVKVYSEDYSKLWGVGKYATAFGEDEISSFDVFGDGRDGDLTITAGQTITVNTILTSVTASANSATVASPTGFVAGDLVLFHQTQGSANVGKWEYNIIQAINGNTWTLIEPLNFSYTSFTAKAQAIKVPQYSNVTVLSGGTITAPAWNGSTGGILAFRVKSALNVAAGGLISVDGKGYSGGVKGGSGQTGQQGESELGIGLRVNNNACGSDGINRNGMGGGGGNGDSGVDRSGGGGGGGSYGALGSRGGCGWYHPGGQPGWVNGEPELSHLLFGGGGGAGGNDNSDTKGGNGGNGGGIVLVEAKNVNANGSITSTGGNGGAGYSCSGGGGGGAGGSIKLISYAITANSGSITATGGGSGPALECSVGSSGGLGGDGRIRIESQSFVGATNPAGSIQQTNYFSTEQKETAPFSTFRLSLPENLAGNQAYHIQLGRRLIFAANNSIQTLIRIPAEIVSNLTIDALLSEIDPGPTSFIIDIGNDNQIDWSWPGVYSSPLPLTSPDLSAAFNAYWATHGAPTSGYLDVPVRVSLDKPGQVLLTNLQVQSAPSKLRTLRLTAGNYSTVSLNYTLGGAVPVTLGIDVGDNGSVDAAFTTNPGTLTSPNLATAVNAFLSGKSGSVDVPVRFYVSPAASLSLTGFTAALSGKPDASLANADLHLPGSSPIEGETVSLSATLRNPSSLATGGLTAAFYATAPGWGEWYIGSVLVPNIPPGGTATAALDWNTLGFSGSVPVRVVVDPHDRLNESSESNNQAAGTLAVLTRPDLQVAGIQPSDAEPVAGETVTVTFTAKNAGQTAAGSSSWRLYDGDPAAGGTLICSPSLAVGAGSQQPQGCPWTPASPGLHRLFVVGDAAGAVGEYDEGNNQLVQEVYVGFAGPLLLDSGSAGQDPAYSPAAGYGVVDTGPADLLTACANWPDPDQTLRQDPGGEVVYQFDHLLLGHYYHLDLILYECNGEGRQESVYVDESLMAGPEDLGDATMHRLSLRLDPALYRDHSVRVVVKAPGGDGAVVAGISLHDVDYRYTDSGSALDVAFPGSKSAGWLDGTPYTSDGTLPYQSYRVDLANNDLHYQFADLDPALRYQLHLTFWQPSGTAHIQRVELDGADSGQVVDTGDYQIHRLTVPIPQSAYQSDGSVVVSILRSNASTGPILNEIALEQLTLVQPLSCDGAGVQVTPYFTEAYGALQFFGQPAPAMETRVLALNPRGQVVGCYVVDTTGQYGLMRLYGEDTSTQPATPGLRAGERVTFQVNGTTAFAQPALYYQNDHAAHPVDLEVKTLAEQSLLLSPGWNLVSFRNEPPSPLVPVLVNPIQSRAARVIGETGIYTPSLADPFVTLKELHALQGYYLLLNGSTSLSWLVAGESQPANTPIALHPGWNWIGGPAQTTPVATALASIAGQYKRVISLTQTYDPSLPPSFSTLKDLKPGAGYLIYANQNTSLTYPVAGGDTVEMQNGLSEPEKPVCENIYPTPAITLVYGEVSINGEPAQAGTRIEFFTPRGELAGCAVLPQTGLLPLTHLYGSIDDNEPGYMEGDPITVHINGLPAELNQPLTWSNDQELNQVIVTGEAIPVYLPSMNK